MPFAFVVLSLLLAGYSGALTEDNGDVEPYFLIALKNEINRLSINGTKLDTVSVEVNTIEAIDYHYRMQYVYMVLIDGAIRRVKLNETEVRSISSPVVVPPAGAKDLAVDWLQNTLYWTSGEPDTNIYMMNLTLLVGDGTPPVLEIRVTSESSSFTYIVLNPINRTMYVLDAPANSIKEIRYDGKQTGKEFGGAYISCPALSYTHNSILWYQGFTILSVQELTNESLPRSYSVHGQFVTEIEYFRERIYWSQKDPMGVFYMEWNKSISVERFLVKDFLSTSVINDVALVHPSKQPYTGNDISEGSDAEDIAAITNSVPPSAPYNGPSSTSTTTEQYQPSPTTTHTQRVSLGSVHSLSLQPHTSSTETSLVASQTVQTQAQSETEIATRTSRVTSRYVEYTTHRPTETVSLPTVHTPQTVTSSLTSRSSDTVVVSSLNLSPGSPFIRTVPTPSPSSLMATVDTLSPSSVALTHSPSLSSTAPIHPSLLRLDPITHISSSSTLPLAHSSSLVFTHSPSPSFLQLAPTTHTPSPLTLVRTHSPSPSSLGQSPALTASQEMDLFTTSVSSNNPTSVLGKFSGSQLATETRGHVQDGSPYTPSTEITSTTIHSQPLGLERVSTTMQSKLFTSSTTISVHVAPSTTSSSAKTDTTAPSSTTVIIDPSHDNGSGVSPTLAPVIPHGSNKNASSTLEAIAITAACLGVAVLIFVGLAISDAIYYFSYERKSGKPVPTGLLGGLWKLVTLPCHWMVGPRYFLKRRKRYQHPYIPRCMNRNDISVYNMDSQQTATTSLYTDHSGTVCTDHSGTVCTDHNGTSTESADQNGTTTVSIDYSGTSAVQTDHSGTTTTAADLDITILSSGSRNSEVSSISPSDANYNDDYRDTLSDYEELTELEMEMKVALDVFEPENEVDKQDLSSL